MQLTKPIPSNAKIACPKKRGKVDRSAVAGLLSTSSNPLNKLMNIMTSPTRFKRLANAENGAKALRLFTMTYGNNRALMITM